MGTGVSHETYISSNKDVIDGRKYWANFDSEPFDKGACRYAFKGKLHGDGPRDNSDCVTKCFMASEAKKFDEWVPDLAASEKASKYAEKFNQVRRSKGFYNGVDIEFLIPLIAKVQQVAHFKLFWLFKLGSDEKYVKEQTYVAIEPFLAGEYKKFNSNGGYEDGFYEIMQTFTHWTWHASGHKFMVCDLQGVITSRRYILTDPAVHSYEQIYGFTDLGTYGMERVLAGHECNNYCKILDLPNPVKGRFRISRPLQQKRSTTYSFQLTVEEQLRRKKKESQFFQVMPAIFEF